jgi:hypothetical protein
VVADLIKEGANVKEKNKDEETSLHKASESGHAAVVQTLLQHGADVAARSKVGAAGVGMAVCARVPACHVCARHNLHGDVCTQSCVSVWLCRGSSVRRGRARDSQPPAPMIINSSELRGAGFNLQEVIPPELESAARLGRRTRGAGLRQLEGVGRKRFVLSSDDDNELRSRCE